MTRHETSINLLQGCIKVVLCYAITQAGFEWTGSTVRTLQLPLKNIASLK